MTRWPLPPRRPCIRMRARLALVPGLSLSYQDRILRTRGVIFMVACPSLAAVLNSRAAPPFQSPTGFRFVAQILQASRFGIVHARQIEGFRAPAMQPGAGFAGDVGKLAGNHGRPAEADIPDSRT